MYLKTPLIADTSTQAATSTQPNTSTQPTTSNQAAMSNEFDFFITSKNKQSQDLSSITSSQTADSTSSESTIDIEYNK